MKKWAITIVVALGFAALGLTARMWVPPLLQFALGKKDVVGPLKDLVELVSRLVTWAAAVFLFIFKLWRDKKDRASKPAQAVSIENTQAGRDVISAGGSVQTGGVSLPAQGNVSVVAEVVGTKTVIYQPPTPVLDARYQLPRPPGDFTGRKDELGELRKAMEAGGVTISGLQGQGGVGKTALALKLAQELAPNYPDAQVYLDLKGVSEKPLTPTDAMAHTIRAFDPEAKLPEKEDELAGLYRSVLHGKRALLLMDNARDAAQVKPLIPPLGCVLLVTSRQRFALPGLHAKNLDTFPPQDAKALLLAVASRIDGEADAIAKLCGYLPLALRLAATALAERKDLAPAEYASRLANEKSPLKLLAGKDESVEASINLSYGLLDSETQKRWRMLAVFPDTFDAPAAAALWEIEGNAAQDSLGRLVQYSLLEWNDAVKRYRLHDLIRDFATERLAPAERNEATRRHAIHYVRVLALADELYLKGGESLRAGLALFDTEWGNVQAGQAWAAAHRADDPGAAPLCDAYPDAGVYCLSLRRHPRERIRWLEAALAAARQVKDRAAEGRHLGNLGNAYRNLGETRRAIEYYEQSLGIAREMGDRRGEGNALGNLGLAYARLGETRRAIEYYERRLAIAREIGDRRGEGNALGNLGNAYLVLGETRRAIEYYERQLAGTREIGDRRGEGNALGNLGNAYAVLSETRRAIGYHEQALAIDREIGDRRAEGQDLGNLGNAYADLGETRRAIEYYEQSLTIAREIGDRRGEGAALWNMSLALDKLRERKKAIEHAEAALKIYEQIEDPNAEKVRKRLEEWKKA